MGTEWALYWSGSLAHIPAACVFPLSWHGTCPAPVCFLTLSGLSSVGQTLVDSFFVFPWSGIRLMEQILHESVYILVSPPCPRTLILTGICPERQAGQWTEILHAKFSRRPVPNIKVRGQGGKTKTTKTKIETKSADLPRASSV